MSLNSDHKQVSIYSIRSKFDGTKRSFATFQDDLMSWAASANPHLTRLLEPSRVLAPFEGYEYQNTFGVPLRAAEALRRWPIIPRAYIEKMAKLGKVIQEPKAYMTTKAVKDASGKEIKMDSDLESQIYFDSLCRKLDTVIRGCITNNVKQTLNTRSKPGNGRLTWIVCVEMARGTVGAHHMDSFYKICDSSLSENGSILNYNFNFNSEMSALRQSLEMDKEETINRKT